MSGRIFQSPRNSWSALALTLTLLGLTAAGWVVQQKNQDFIFEKAVAQRELSLLALIVHDVLQRGEYQNLEHLLPEWGASQEIIIELHVTAKNGASLAEYRRQTPASRLLTLSTPIEYSYTGYATLTMTRSLSHVYEHAYTLGRDLALMLVLMGTLLGFLVQLSLKREQEAAALRQRTQQLRDANSRLQDEVVQRRQAEEELFAAKESAEVTLHSIGDAVISTDAKGLVEYMNPVAEALTGWLLTEAQGKALEQVFNIINEVTREPAEHPVQRCLRTGLIVGLANHTVLVARNGNEIAIEDSAAPIRARSGEIVGVVLVFHDVTQSRAISQQLSWHASHDQLTGLINRREFENRLALALASSQADGSHHALFYLDLDQFKVVNDTGGHVAGDELLRQLSALLQKHMRASDTLGRLGGDEFGILLESCPIDHAIRIAGTLLNAARDFRFSWDKKTFEVSASIGIVPIHRDSGTLHQILSAVDLACYMAKERGRNRYHVYHESDADLARRHDEMLWVSRINQALHGDHFVLYQQAMCPTHGTLADGFYEVLLRIQNDDGTLSAPGSFMPAAERYGLMSAIDRWVIKHLFASQAGALSIETADEDNGRRPAATINLSGASLNDEAFLDFIRDSIAEFRINPHLICFEITETVVITHLNRAITLITSLREIGCRFALDDFGSGLSSFGYLKNLPVDFLKIDGGLVRNIVDNPIDAAMVEAINDIGHVMGLKTIAEFVETDAIRRRLADIGVDYVQGYGVEMPHPLLATSTAPGATPG